MDGKLYIFFQFSDEHCGCIWSQQASHIFDAENIRPHVFKVFSHLDVEIYIVDRTDGIADTTFDCFSAFFHGVNGCFYISEIIERIEDSENIYSNLHRLFYKSLDDIICIMPIAHSILASQQHLKWGLGHFFLEYACSFPGIFIQKTDTGIKGGATPHFQREKTHLIEFFCNG